MLLEESRKRDKMENIKVKNVIISKQGEESENYSRLLNIVKNKKFK